MNTESNFVERYSLPAFLILTPLLSLALPLFLALPQEIVPLLIAILPAVMAITFSALSDGSRGVGSLLKKLFQGRVALKWYLIALGLALVLRLTMSLLALLLGWIPAIQLVEWGPAQYLLIGVFTVIGAVVEELGWRGYVLPKLLARRSALASALIIGVPWGILHLSLTFPGQMNAGTSWLATIVFLVALSVILTWFFIQTGHGILVGLVYHAAQNYFVFFNGGISLAESLGLMTAVTTAIAITLILVYGPSLQRSLVKESALVEIGQGKEIFDMQKINSFANEHPSLFGLIATIVFLLMLIVSAILGNLWPGEEVYGQPGGILGRLISIAIVLAVVSRLGWLRSAGFTSFGSWRTWLLSILSLVYVIPVSAYVLTGSFGVPISSVLPSGMVILFILISAFLEEVVFRGLILGGLVYAWGSTNRGVVKSILVSSLLFCSIHLLDFLGGRLFLAVFLQSLEAFFLGVILAVLVIRGKSIYPAFFFHGILNIGAYLSFSYKGLEPSPASWLSLSLMMLLPALFGMYLLRKVSNKAITGRSAA